MLLNDAGPVALAKKMLAQSDAEKRALRAEIDRLYTESAVIRENRQLREDNEKLRVVVNAKLEGAEEAALLRAELELARDENAALKRVQRSQPVQRIGELEQENARLKQELSAMRARAGELEEKLRDPRLATAKQHAHVLMCKIEELEREVTRLRNL